LVAGGEKTQVLSFFKDEVDNLMVPGKVRCEQFLAEHSSIHHHWKIIKNCVYTEVTKSKRQGSD
jgi:hypothetical protein